MPVLHLHERDTGVVSSSHRQLLPRAALAYPSVLIDNRRNPCQKVFGGTFRWRIESHQRIRHNALVKRRNQVSRPNFYDPLDFVLGARRNCTEVTIPKRPYPREHRNNSGFSVRLHVGSSVASNKKKDSISLIMGFIFSPRPWALAAIVPASSIDQHQFVSGRFPKSRVPIL